MLIVNLFFDRGAGLGIGAEFHFLTVLHAFTFPFTAIGFQFGDLRITELNYRCVTNSAGIQPAPG